MKTETALILLPVEYNPNKKGKRGQIPVKDFQAAAVEIAELYGLGCTLDLYPKHGIWVKLGVIYKDVNVILEINSFPIVERGRLIKYCRNKLLSRFKQKAILIKFISQVQAKTVIVEK